MTPALSGCVAQCRTERLRDVAGVAALIVKGLLRRDAFLAASVASTS
jgi:hypothetical protein